MATYLLISKVHQESIIRHLQRLLPTTELERDTLRSLIHTLERAPETFLPEIHQFRNSVGQLHDIAGWNRDDAEIRIHQESGVHKPLTWEGCHIHWPGMHAVTRRS